MSGEALVEVRQVTKRFGATITAAGVTLELARGEFFTLLGPSGSGKSTILRMIAGLERPDSGRVLIAGRDVTDLPPWRRGLGMVFQNYAVFPHMTVGQNVGYGLRRLALGREAREARVRELLALVGLTGFADRRPQTLSGGEQQRVAIARALAPRPEVLLLDEPLSALDEKIRREMQVELRNIQLSTKTTFVYVTHDQEEALTMSDRIAVLNFGHVVQCDTPERIYRVPRTSFVARFFRGCNVLTVEGSGTAARLCGVPLPVAPSATPGAVAIRAENVQLDPAAKDDQLLLEATLESSTYRGLYTEHLLMLPDGQRLSAIEQRHRKMAQGSPVCLGVRRPDIVPLDPD
jgi:ABC-type Fe3+/spermidine/putrescine transport system ATPase subunit